MCVGILVWLLITPRTPRMQRSRGQFTWPDPCQNKGKCLTLPNKVLSFEPHFNANQAPLINNLLQVKLLLVIIIIIFYCLYKYCISHILNFYKT